MSEPGDELSRHYRALPREEPPAGVDAAILAASRRAVAPAPRRAARWAGPVSIAAVLVLGIGLTLRMQHERPGIETAAPASEYSLPAPPAESPAQATAAPEAREPVQAQKPREAPRRLETQERASPSSAQVAPPAAPPPAARESTAAPAPEPPTVPARASPPSPPSPPAPAAASPAPPMAASAPAPSMMRSKREALASSSDAVMDRGAPEDPVVMLERIAKLRADARHAEADKALEEFRRVHPQYRIPEPMWERVKPR
ncbi:MAG TPA: hypothetical protein VFK48_13195 [Usitatibacter sp.]|nr:hypothetical protein [Usitatibacter sp.]